jgi:predicted amidohydrolase YtcJ
MHQIYHEAHINNSLRTRIRASLPIASWKRLLAWREHSTTLKPQSSCCDHHPHHKHPQHDHDWLQTDSLKAMIDGSLGTHTAAFFSPYTDAPPGSAGDSGHLIWDPDILRGYMDDASQHGLQLCVHAIGDRANHVQLNLFEDVARKAEAYEGGKKKAYDFRFRIEHAQHIHPNDIKRFGELGVIASMQMTHLSDDGRWAERVIGKKR